MKQNTCAHCFNIHMNHYKSCSSVTCSDETAIARSEFMTWNRFIVQCPGPNIYISKVRQLDNDLSLQATHGKLFLVGLVMRIQMMGQFLAWKASGLGRSVCRPNLTVPSWAGKYSMPNRQWRKWTQLPNWGWRGILKWPTIQICVCVCVWTCFPSSRYLLILWSKRLC